MKNERWKILPRQCTSVPKEPSAGLRSLARECRQGEPLGGEEPWAHPGEAEQQPHAQDALNDRSVLHPQPARLRTEGIKTQGRGGRYYGIFFHHGMEFISEYYGIIRTL